MSIAINPIGTFELGEMYEHDNDVAIDIETINVWVNAVYMLEGVTRIIEYHDDDGDTYLKLPVGAEHDGSYWITWSVSAIGAQAETYEFGIDINGTVENKSVARTEQGKLGTMAASGTSLLELVSGDEIRGAARNLTSTDDITVIHSNIAVVRI